MILVILIFIILNFKKYELYKCDILIERFINYRFAGGFKHTAELKKCKTIKEHYNEVNTSLFINTDVKNNNDVVE